MSLSPSLSETSLTDNSSCCESDHLFLADTVQWMSKSKYLCLDFNDSTVNHTVIRFGDCKSLKFLNTKENHEIFGDALLQACENGTFDRIVRIHGFDPFYQDNKTIVDHWRWMYQLLPNTNRNRNNIESKTDDNDHDKNKANINCVLQFQCFKNNLNDISLPIYIVSKYFYQLICDLIKYDRILTITIGFLNTKYNDGIINRFSSTLAIDLSLLSDALKATNTLNKFGILNTGATGTPWWLYQRLLSSNTRQTPTRSNTTTKTTFKNDTDYHESSIVSCSSYFTEQAQTSPSASSSTSPRENTSNNNDAPCGVSSGHNGRNGRNRRGGRSVSAILLSQHYFGTTTLSAYPSSNPIATTQWSQTRPENSGHNTRVNFTFCNYLKTYKDVSKSELKRIEACIKEGLSVNHSVTSLFVACNSDIYDCCEISNNVHTISNKNFPKQQDAKCEHYKAHYHEWWPMIKKRNLNCNQCNIMLFNNTSNQLLWNCNKLCHFKMCQIIIQNVFGDIYHKYNDYFNKKYDKCFCFKCCSALQMKFKEKQNRNKRCCCGCYARVEHEHYYSYTPNKDNEDEKKINSNYNQNHHHHDHHDHHHQSSKRSPSISVSPTVDVNSGINTFEGPYVLNFLQPQRNDGNTKKCTKKTKNKNKRYHFNRFCNNEYYRKLEKELKQISKQLKELPVGWIRFGIDLNENKNVIDRVNNKFSRINGYNNKIDNKKGGSRSRQIHGFEEIRQFENVRKDVKEEIMSKWHKCYYSVSSKNDLENVFGSDLTLNIPIGIKKSNYNVYSIQPKRKRFDRLNQFTKQIERFDLNQIFTTPSIKYASHPAKVCKQIKTDKFVVSVFFFCFLFVFGLKKHPTHPIFFGCNLF